MVISGKDKGREGEVLQCAPKLGKVLVEGVNLVKKHIKGEKTKKGGKIGQRIELPTFISVSKVMFICPKCKKATRLGMNVSKDSKRRVCKKCKQIVDEKD